MKKKWRVCLSDLRLTLCGNGHKLPEDFQGFFPLTQIKGRYSVSQPTTGESFMRADVKVLPSLPSRSHRIFIKCFCDSPGQCEKSMSGSGHWVAAGRWHQHGNH